MENPTKESIKSILEDKGFKANVHNIELVYQMHQVEMGKKSVISIIKELNEENLLRK